jgi:hypothetical protein
MPDGARIEPQDDRAEPDEPVAKGFIFPADLGQREG